MQSLYSQLRHGYHITTHIIYAESIFTIKTWIPHNYQYNLCRVYMGSYDMDIMS